MKRKITHANEAAKVRLRAVEAYQKGGVTMRDLAVQFSVHVTTISEWVKMYEQGGVERLNAPLKPRSKHELNVEELEARHKAAPLDVRIASLLDLARSGNLNETAAAWNITPQGLAKRRRKYLKT